MSLSRNAQVAATLPPRLIRFFERFPPPQLFPNQASSPAAAATVTAVPHIEVQSTTPPPPSVTSTTSPTDPNTIPTESIDAPLSTPQLATQSRTAALAAASLHELGYHNPFLPRKNHATGKWYGPVYGLRQQADLVKLAQAHGVLDLLPYTVKKPGEKLARRLESGLQVKGTGEGQKVKGKIWERDLKHKLFERRQAMMRMPALIQEWKQRGHGRGWKKWPK